MRLLHLVGKNMNTYIVIDKIVKFDIFFDNEKRSYIVDLQTNIGPVPLAINTTKPSEIVEDLLKTMKH